MVLERFNLQVDRLRFRFASQSRARLWERVAALCDAGVAIASAMEFLYASKTTGTAAAGFVRHQRTAMRTGGFAAGAQGWVPQEELTIIEVTQEGRISEGLQQAARIASVRSKLRSTLYSGLAYPTVLLVLAVIVMAILPGEALEVMTEIMDIRSWPAVSRWVLAFSEFLKFWSIPLAVALLILISASIYAAPRWSGTLRNRLDWIPPFALYRQFSAPEILSAWLALMATGTTRVRALTQLEKGLPGYLAAHVRTMKNQLYRGDPIETALDTGLFSAETLDDLRIYEMTGGFDRYSDQLAEEDISRALKRLESSLQMLSSILLLVIGGCAVWVYIGIAKVTFAVQYTAF